MGRLPASDQPCTASPGVVAPVYQTPLTALSERSVPALKDNPWALENVQLPCLRVEELFQASVVSRLFVMQVVRLTTLQLLPKLPPIPTTARPAKVTLRIPKFLPIASMDHHLYGQPTRLRTTELLKSACRPIHAPDVGHA